MEFKQQILLEQKQVLAANQIQSLELLSLSNADLDTFMQNEYMENPILESTRLSSASSGDDDYRKWYNNLPAKTETVGLCLWDQLEAHKYGRIERNVIEVLIGCLDDNGFFSTPLSEIQALTNASEEVILSCLEDLKQLEPEGVFAAGLSECLLRQVDVLGIEDETLRTVIRDHLEELSEGKIASITRKLGISSTAVRKYNAFIQTLNPRPLSGFGREQADYVIPDILVTRSADGYEIALNDRWTGSYQLNDYYMKILSKTQDPELSSYFQEKRKRALFILEAIEQRRKTMLKIMRSLIKLQNGLLAEKEKLKPVTMKEVADDIEMHVSTVSRAVKGKYVQYPKGTIAMKDFFSLSVSGDSNAGQIKAEIIRLIHQEDKKNPYSDANLAKLLGEKGVTLSRRGVAKYRTELGIKGSFDRKLTGVLD